MSGSSFSRLNQRLNTGANAKKAKILSWFFKTGPGEYGEGDKFLGFTVPVLRALAHQHRDLPLRDLSTLLQSPWHEKRLIALILLRMHYEKGGASEKEKAFRFYLRHLKRINNWDLVDASVSYIVGDSLMARRRALLYTWAKSPNLWIRRMSIVATGRFIRDNDLTDTFRISERLLGDKEDLIHKAAGWMLREAGKKNQPALERFLKKHLVRMPRTMLRYAIEKFPEPKRKAYLQGRV